MLVPSLRVYDGCGFMVRGGLKWFFEVRVEKGKSATKFPKVPKMREAFDFTNEKFRSKSRDLRCTFGRWRGVACGVALGVARWVTELPIA